MTAGIAAISPMAVATSASAMPGATVARLAAPFAPMLQTGVDVNLPQAKAQTIPDDEGKLILTVTKDKRVFLGKLQIPWEDVEKTLKNNAKLNADHELYLHADKDLPYGEVVKVMAAVKQAGVDKLGMVTDPLE